MPQLLPANGVLRYNGYTFDGAVHVNVSSKMVQDEASRTVLYHEITISVQAVVANTSGTDGDLHALRRQLGEQGKALIFTSHGFGNDLVVNSGGVRDVRWGPKPQVISWTPIGAGNACEVEWQVTTCVPLCEMSPYPRFTGVMSINYSVSYALDEKGYTTRTISGHLLIAQTRNGRNVPDSADRYRHLIAPRQPLGYHRTYHWDTSADKSRLDFTITDTQKQTHNAYPPGVVEIRGSHRVSYSRRSGFLKNRINLDIEMAADRSILEAYQIMLNIVGRRRAAATTNGKVVFIEDVSVDEDLFSRRAGFSIGYRLTGSVKDILTGTGLWTPLNYNWTQWALSMAPTFNDRGHSGLSHQPASDAIIDLCGSANTIPWDLQNNTLTARPRPAGRGLRNVKPDPAQSWLQYQSSVEVQRQRPVSRQSSLQPRDLEALPWNPNDDAGANYPLRGGDDDVIQEGGRSRYSAVFRGYAYRVGYEIPRPAVVSIGQQPATEIDGRFEQRQVGESLGVPVYAAAWEIRYALPNSPERTAPPVNVHDGQGAVLIAR